jgi:hypothetical protein
MTRSRAFDLVLLAGAIALLVFGLLSDGLRELWGGGVLILFSVVRVAVPGYKFDPRKSAIQQWRERRRL